MIDRAALDAIEEAGRQSGEKIIADYADTTVAIADIKIAYPFPEDGKGCRFHEKCHGRVRKHQPGPADPGRAFRGGGDRRYLEGTSYAGGAESLRESPSAFERWCDNRMIETLKSQKYETFSVGPLLAYLVARETEIRTVRIILTGKQNGFSDDAIRERIRKCMYKIAVVGDYDSIYGFATLGLEICPAGNREEIRNTLRRLAEEDYGIIYITEAAAAEVESDLEVYQERMLPAVIQIPGVSGNTGAGVQGVRRTVEQAVGSDILFGGVS